jgi:hypothetical protein
VSSIKNHTEIIENEKKFEKPDSLDDRIQKKKYEKEESRNSSSAMVTPLNNLSFKCIFACVRPTEQQVSTAI